MALIGLVGKTQVGKDTVGKIIQMLTDNLLDGIPDDAVEDCVLNTPILDPSFKNVKYADKLKDCVCLILGCTREQLEDDTFKDAPLGKEWTVWYCHASGHGDELYTNKEEAKKVAEFYYSYIKNSPERYTVSYEDAVEKSLHERLLTPRLLLQLLGTQCGRHIIHPNIWVNATMAEYKEVLKKGADYDLGDVLTDIKHLGKPYPPLTYPNWIITDVRFPNEVKAIKDRGGIIIKINRNEEERFPSLYFEFTKSNYKDFYHFLGEKYPVIYSKVMHESETALDNYIDYDAVIGNSGFITDTVKQVKSILKNHNIWMKEN